MSVDTRAQETRAQETRDRLRIGVMGCADIAWRRTLPAMAGNPAVEIAAIASRSKSSAVEFTDRFGGVPLEGYESLLDQDGLDALYIPLPGLLHAEWVERALRAGKHVLVEKPMTGSHAETVRLVELARASGLVLLENYMFLHHSQHEAVRRTLADGAIGELRGFSSTFTIPPKPAGDIRYQSEVGGGPFLDFGGYPVRAAQYFLGSELRVVGAVFRHHEEHRVAMSGSVLLCTPDGIPAQLTFGMEHSYGNSYSLSASTGRLTLDRAFTPPPTYQPVLRIERQDHSEERTLPADDQFANIVDTFVQAVLGERCVREHQEGTLRQAALIQQIQRVAYHTAI
ncbi:oxidoreductase [Streptomyces lunaelactis]|uniref:Oxidoreductase n=1 Tax=Streptomyces lunaelactis TaxID=1535768 RepID=A0A2R4T1U7_9ACTN|nr:Gfo/Idh/MocA family oxidoreductase [Streptomyces lunaelactis]AVZ73100.1 oxidoreductase [Streptomyces lunaelactis]NUK03890.1 Gfo/Idh/MocA family oxidoreductase [Streptomyces lunaelactis]NUK10799.1 Gfo/Idh/MocA family oxidoreductase [Streptomyces lunaelactis]NUK18914.1 Gfo/Idh/MocA family oxidoreductase [Streptomyces lunaelactis]NUK26330.1 Gfo/Idh/MocA family oxidoreductase [Streptomyces lunaelactis]